MSKIKPFKGLRPVPDKAEQVASPPYDVLNSDEARAMAQGNPLSFLHVVKPEIDLDRSIDLYADEVYAKGAENLGRLQTEGVLARDEQPCLYVYAQTMRIGDRNHFQVGVLAGASVEEYENELIKKHEHTRPDKEADRTRHVEALGANTGPVFLTYRAEPAIDVIVSRVAEGEPTYDFTAADGISHQLWVVDDEPTISALVEAFDAIPCSYVADGHHRSASAAAAGRRRREANTSHTGDEPYNFYLAVFFPHDQLYIMDYNRVVLDLAGLSENEFLDRVGEKFEVAPSDAPKPGRATEFGMYLGGKWYRLTAKVGTYDAGDAVNSLDVAILQDNLLAPMLGIEDPRTDKRIDFVGGIRGTTELERRVNEGGAVAFALFATSIEQLMAIADAGQIMPPKSTWFEPKLRSGLVVNLLD
ncbi:MAG: DUF1015 domain-containing protein [Deltaproteobacteria bacterium]|nr:DUF1015 domain-containing protein [Deltaproteobacteria bacterium]